MLNIMKEVTFEQLLGFLGPACFKTIGEPPTFALKSCKPISEVEAPQTITFSSRADDQAVSLVMKTRAAVVICRHEPAFEALNPKNKILLLVANPRLSFMRVVQKFFAAVSVPGIHASALVENSKIDPSASIGPNCFVHDAVIGKNVIVHANTVIGTDGFGYERNEDGVLEKFPHLGNVVIGDDVEIGSNTCIDRASLGSTRIESGVKIDNLVHIAHNVVIGENSVVIAHAMVGGSVKIGKGAWVAPSVAIRNGLSIGDHGLLGMGSIIIKDIPDYGLAYGNPAELKGFVCVCQKRLDFFEQRARCACGKQYEKIGEKVRGIAG